MIKSRTLRLAALLALPLIGGQSALAGAVEPARAIAKPTVELGPFAEALQAARCEANVLVECDWSWSRHQCECGTMAPLGGE